MTIKIRLQQSKFKDANNGGKWHARTVNTGDVLTSDLANEIQATTTFTRGEVEGFITELVDVIARNLRDGHTVVVDGLGRFHLAVESKPVDNPMDFDIKKNISDIKLKFVPAGKRSARTNRKVDDFGYGVQIQWAEEPREEEDSRLVGSPIHPVVKLPSKK